MNTMKKLSYTLRIEEQKRLTLFVRAVSIIFVPLYVWGLFDLLSDSISRAIIDIVGQFLFDASPEWIDFIRPSPKFIILFLAIGLAVNFGPFFLTVPAARGFKACATIMYLPTCLLTPIVLTGRTAYIPFMILLIGAMVVYDRFNPWRTRPAPHTSRTEPVPSGHRLWHLLRIEKRRNLALFVRTVSVSFVPLYMWSLFDLKFEWYRYTLEYFIAFLVGTFFWGVVINAAPFLLTCPTAKQYPFTATGCYLPTIFLTPLIIGIQINAAVVAVLFFGALSIYFLFNPWRK